MPIVNFYLKKAAGPIPDSLIYLQFKYNGRKLVYSFGQKINPADWSKVQKRVKSNRQTILDGRYALNEVLDRLEKVCLKAYNEELAKGIPPVSVLRFRLDHFIHQHKGRKEAPRLYQLFDRFISGEFLHKGKEKSRHTLKNYSTTKNHLHSFDIATRYHVDFENINLEFFQRYTTFLKEELKLQPNSIARDIRILKTVLAGAVQLDYTTNIQFRHQQFKLVDEPTDAVWLTEKEIAVLSRCDLSGNKRLAQVRDLFLLGCYTGSKLSSARNPDGPEHPLARKILENYGGAPPKAPSNQKFNSYLKEVCRAAGLTEKGRLPSNPRLELWECVTSDTARRSMAANAWLADLPLASLMKQTGHKTEKAFLRYIRAEKLRKPVKGS